MPRPHTHGDQARWATRVRAVGRDPQRIARSSIRSIGAHVRRDSPEPLVPAAASIGHAEALVINGFTVFRNLVPTAECAELAASLKRAAGIVEGQRFTRTDATVKIPATRTVLFDPRVLDAVRSSLGGTVRFLQVGDLHYLSDTTAWHRDSVHRAEDNQAAADWSDAQGRFAIVKAILYLESDNAAMGLIPGSHLSPRAADLFRARAVESRGKQVIVDVDSEPNRVFTDAERAAPLVWRAQPGDLLVFDQRLYHCGRRVDHGAVTKDREAAKFTLSLVFGLDNPHSERFFSYFRYARRELGYRVLPDDLRAQLQDNDLLLSGGLGNYYEQHPEEIRLAALRRETDVDTLVADFRRAGSSQSSA